MYTELPHTNWISKSLESSKPGMGSVIRIDWGGSFGLFIRSFSSWFSEFDYESIEPGTVPSSIEIFYEGLPPDFELGDHISPDGYMAYDITSDNNWMEV